MSAMRTKWLLLFGVALCTGAFGQGTYPSRAVRIVVPFPPGGTADAVPRIVAEKLTARWGQPVIIENRPGAGGNIGAEVVANAEPDGYTLMVTPPPPIAVNQYLYKKLAYDPTRFVPISVLATHVSVLATRPDFPAPSVQELVNLAKQAPGKLVYASQGNGTISHLTAAMFQQMAGVQMLHVPYKGTAPAMTDLMGGQVDVFFDNLSSSLAQYRAGKIKILAVASQQRSPSLPSVPSLHEAGIPGFQSITWNVLAGPDRLPEAIAQQLSQAVADALKLPDVQKKYADLGGQAWGTTPAEAASFIAEERARWRKVIQSANVTLD
jgi:tripartite-type tricarboxylate transporter receptor subunit TctC